MADDNNRRDSASMDEDEERVNANKGGQNQGKENNPENLANNRAKASEAGRKGGQN